MYTCKKQTLRNKYMQIQILYGRGTLPHTKFSIIITGRQNTSSTDLLPVRNSGRHLGIEDFKDSDLVGVDVTLVEVIEDVLLRVKLPYRYPE
jgi:hypothetical protein